MRSIINYFIILFTIAMVLSFPLRGAGQSIGGSISIDPESGEGATGTRQADGEEPEIPEIVDYSDRLIIRPYLLVPMNFLVINHYDSDSGSKSDDITYLPNPTLCAGAGVSWWIFGVSFHMATTPLRDTGDYGETVFLDLQFNYYFRKFGFDLFYQRYRGYSLNEADSYHMPQGEAGAVRSDLTITAIGGNFFYIFSDHFSYNAAFKGTERQTASGGSFILMASLINNNIDSDYSLIPPEQEPLYGNDAGFQSGNFTSIGISPGYARTFIFTDGFYVTPSICVGTGLMRKSYSRLSGDKTIYGSFIKFNFRFAAGYNGDRWFYGLALVVDGTSSMSSMGGRGISASTYGGYLETFAGYRI